MEIFQTIRVVLGFILFIALGIKAMRKIHQANYVKETILAGLTIRLKSSFLFCQNATGQNKNTFKYFRLAPFQSLYYFLLILIN